MRLARLDTGEDAQIRKRVPAARHVGKVTLDVEWGHPSAVREDPVGEIDVLGDASPGRPNSTARAQARCIDEVDAVSQDHRVWT